MLEKILVVDASRTVRTFVRRILERAEFQVIETDSMETALDFLKKNPDFSAILSGLNLPGEATCRLEDFQLYNVPLILMFCNDRDAAFCDWMARIEVRGCVRKPIEDQALLGVIRRTLVPRVRIEA